MQVKSSGRRKRASVAGRRRSAAAPDAPPLDSSAEALLRWRRDLDLPKPYSAFTASESTRKGGRDWNAPQETERETPAGPNRRRGGAWRRCGNPPRPHPQLERRGVMTEPAAQAPRWASPLHVSLGEGPNALSSPSPGWIGARV